MAEASRTPWRTGPVNPRVMSTAKKAPRSSAAMVPIKIRRPEMDRTESISSRFRDLTFWQTLSTCPAVSERISSNSACSCRYLLNSKKLFLYSPVLEITSPAIFLFSSVVNRCSRSRDSLTMADVFSRTTCSDSGFSFSMNSF